jgi:hypothetical protein
MTFTRRTFPQVLDNLLTDITGGVAAEDHPFPPPGAGSPPYRHSLQQPPASDVISVYGVRDGQAHLFRKGVDYELLSDRKTLAWKETQKGAQLPDPGTLFYVNYYPAAAKRVLTDLQVGSVLRTLSESVALEFARLYAQLEAVYRSAYIDTATGSALDNVVALLGIQRVRSGRPAGEIEFTRVPGTKGEINIPAGTRVMTADGEVHYETTGPVTMAPGQNTIRVVARDLEANDPLPADALAVLPIPIAGIASVSNPAPTAVTTEDETDEELRARATSFLHGSERATLGAIGQALVTQGVSADVEEVADTPGVVEVTPHVESMSPELEQRLLTAIEAVRPAGVKVILKGAEPPLKVDLRIRLTTGSTLLPADRRAVQRTARERLAGYFGKLPAKQPASVNKIIALVSGIAGVEEMRLLSATAAGANVLDLAAGELAVAGTPTALGDLSIADPALPTMLDAVVTFPADQAAADRAAIQTALNNALAYVNNMNASDLPSGASTAEQERRVLSYGKLLWIIPLPGKPGASLEDYDTAVATGTPPSLPTAAAIAPYKAQFVFTQESGQSRILAGDAGSYALTPFERLSLNSVEVQPRSGNA